MFQSDSFKKAVKLYRSWLQEGRKAKLSYLKHPKVGYIFVVEDGHPTTWVRFCDVPMYRSQIPIYSREVKNRWIYLHEVQVKDETYKPSKVICKGKKFRGYSYLLDDNGDIIRDKNGNSIIEPQFKYYWRYNLARWENKKGVLYIDSERLSNLIPGWKRISR